jgi:hypothetical protein
VSKQIGYAVLTEDDKVAWTGSNRSGYRKIYMTKGGAASACAHAMSGNFGRHVHDKLRVAEVYIK